ncbi:MAG: tetratricopeptide repeat protein [Ardenticatenaceae bacterium]|nr:tetratricopeptide repeat protein [Ardenticatenaceae bacterium]
MNQKSLQISLLGGAQIEQAGTAVTGFASRKAEALFIYLVCQQRPIPRGSLAVLLWPENDQTRALANLSVVLTSLRKQLDDYLLADRQTVAFNAAADFRLDVAEFEQAVSEVRDQQQKSGKLSRTSAAQLAAAVSLYQGDFLAGFNVRSAADFEAWVLLEQERLRQMMLDALSDLAAFHLQRGQYEDGIGYGRQLAALDPLLEEAHRLLIQLYAQNNQRAQALAQYEQCCQILADELGVEPDEATTALCEEIQAGERQPKVAGSERAGEISPLLPATSGRRPPVPLHNLPAAANAFIGRVAELARIEDWLADGDGRLLTLIGPGGMGKTRLAQEAARGYVGEFLDGVWYISLTPLQDAVSIVPAIAEVLGYSFAGTADPPSELLVYLRGREMLLILDNFEHLLRTTGLEFISQLLAQAPDIKLLATSRERLNTQAEQLLELRGLPYPTRVTDDELRMMDFPAIQLFANRAQRLRADFKLDGQETAVIQLCHLVDGLPLALELAATWIRTLTLPEIVAEIERGLDFLATAVRDLPDRHRSLRAVFDTSWQMLSEQEQMAVQQLSVFRGGFSRQAAQAVANASMPIMAALVDKSFMRLDEDGRYRRHPLLIQFAAEKLAANPELETQTRRCHAGYYGRFCQELESYLLGAQPEVGTARLAPEQDNVRQAWHWAAENRAAALLNQMADTVMQAFDLLGLYRDERAMAEHAVRALAGFDEAEAVLARGRSLGLLGGVDFRLGNYERSVAESKESIEILAAVRPHIAYAHSHVYLGAGRFGLGQFEQACADWETAVAAYEEGGSRWGQTVCLGNLAEARLMLGDLVSSQSYAKRAYHIAQQLNNAEQMGASLISLAKVASQEKRFEDATGFGQQALDLFQQTGHKVHIANALAILGSAAQQRGQRDQAHRFFAESVTMQRQAGNQLYLVSRLLEWGQAALALDDLVQAETVLVEALREAYMSQMTPFALNALAFLADLFQRRGRLTQAVQMATFVIGHDAAVPEALQTAETVLQAAVSYLPADRYQLAQENGRTADFPDFLPELF